jgi:hypothetical protein
MEVLESIQNNNLKCVICGGNSDVYCSTCWFYFCHKHDVQHHMPSSDIHVRVNTIDKDSYSSYDYQVFANSILNRSYLTMRFETCKDLFDILTNKNKILIKSPPGSGKTILARLFEHYLKKFKKIKNVFFLLPYHTIDHSLEEPLISIVNNYSDTKDATYFIFDETQMLYDKELLWETIKFLESKINLKFVFFASFYPSCLVNNTLTTSLPHLNFIFDPYCDILSMEFMRLRRSELNEMLINFYKYDPMAEDLKINKEEMLPIIESESSLHVYIVSIMFDYFIAVAKTKNKMEITKHTFLSHINTRRFYRYIYYSKLVWHETICKLNSEERDLLIKISEYDLYKPESEKMYIKAKELEKNALLNEVPSLVSFNIVSEISRRAMYYFSIKQEINIPLNLKNLSLVDFIVESLKRFDYKCLPKYITHENIHRESQWNNKLFAAMKSVINFSTDWITCLSSCYGNMDLLISSDKLWAVKTSYEGLRHNNEYNDWIFKELVGNNFILLDFYSIYTYKKIKDLPLSNCLRVILDDNRFGFNVFYENKFYTFIKWKSN